MLKSLYANKASFRRITFKENALNIVIAKKHKGAAATASRNGLGKSTLVNIISFCLGLSVDTKNELPLDELEGWAWTLELSIRGKDYAVTRGADNPDEVRVKGDFAGCPVTGTAEAMLGEGVQNVFRAEEWRLALNWLFFSLSPADVRGGDGNATPPDYKSLMGHFIRREFDDPVRVKSGDSRTASELAITYLLGLDWQFLANAKGIRKERQEAEMRINGAKMQLSTFGRERAVLEFECRRIETEIDAAERALAKFDAVPQAQLVDGNLAEYTLELSRLDREIIRKARLLRSARESKDKSSVSIEPLVEFYAKLGSVFSDGAKRTLEEVKAFHEKLTANRDALIDRRIGLLDEELAELQRERSELNERRRKLAESINANAVFEDYMRRTDSLNQLREELAKKKDCLEMFALGEEQRAAADRKRDELVATAEETNKKFKDRRDREEAFYRKVINALYSDAIPRKNRDATSLGIEIRNEKGDCGISYKPRFWGDRSLGRKKLKAFAFDLTILNEQKNISSTVDFMVHDSVLYESSDSRQYAKALLYVSEMCSRLGMQYIGVMNSDDVSTEDFKGIFPEAKLKGFVIHELNDNPSGEYTLLGEFFPKDL